MCNEFITKRLLELQKGANLTKSEYCTRVGITRPQLYALERGKATMNVFLKVCAYHKVRVLLVPQEWVN